MHHVGQSSPQVHSSPQPQQSSYGQQVLDIQKQQQEVQNKVARGELSPQEGDRLQQQFQQQLLALQQGQQPAGVQTAPAPAAPPPAPISHAAPFSRDTFEPAPRTPTEYRYSPPKADPSEILDRVLQKIGERSGGGSKLGIVPD